MCLSSLPRLLTVGQPMGKSGSSLGMCYMGAPKIDPMTTLFYEPGGAEPRVRRRSLGKLLRHTILPIMVAPLWERSHRFIFCSFDGTIRAVRQGKIDDLLYKYGGGGGDSKYGALLGNAGHHPILRALVVRLELGHRYLNAMPRTGSYAALLLQLWIDEMLDLTTYFVNNNPRPETTTPLQIEQQYEILRPHGRRFVWGGELPDLSTLLPMANMWHEIRPVLKENVVCELIHLLLCKTQHHKCQIRNIIRILWIYAGRHNVLIRLIKDIVHVVLMGNWPHASYRPSFMARMELRQSSIRFMNDAGFDESINWMSMHRRIVYFSLKEYYLYLLGHCSPAESVLRETQYHDLHKQSVFRVMDTVRHMIDRSSPQLSLVEGELKRVHNDCLKFLTKLRKGSFVRVVRAKLKTWTVPFLKKKMKEAVDLLKGSEKTGSLAVEASRPVWVPQNAARSAPWGCSILLELEPEFLARILMNLDLRNLAMASRTCRKICALCWNEPIVLRQCMARSLPFLPPALAEMLWPVTQIDLESETLRNITLAAQYSAARDDGWFDARWLPVLGMTQEGYEAVKKLYLYYDWKDGPDNAISKRFLPIYRHSPRDFAIFYGFVSEVVRCQNIEIRPLDVGTVRYQVEVLRMRSGVKPWEPTPDDIGARHYCAGCARWADVVVTPEVSDTNIYALGLASASYDAINRVLHCKRGMTPGCSMPLRTINMIGVAVRMSGTKRPSRWYALCATCGILTTWSEDRMTSRGPDCGAHAPIPQNGGAAVQRPPSLRSDPRLTEARLQAGLMPQSSVVNKCVYCGLNLVGQRKGYCVRVLDENYKIAQMHLCLKDYKMSSRLFRTMGTPTIAAVKSSIYSLRQKNLLRNLRPTLRARNVWEPIPDRNRTH